MHPDLPGFGNQTFEDSMKPMNIYLVGVGGQGIGLLAEVLLRAVDYAGLPVKGVDTHGLAQRGGIVSSHLRIGPAAHSPLVMEGQADLVVALERHEALRAARMLRPGGVMVYYDAVWQPLEVRLNQAPEVTGEMIAGWCGQNGIRIVRAFRDDLESPAMQNIVLLAHICTNRLIAAMERIHVEQAMTDLLEGPMLEKNLELFRSECGSGSAA
jgi:indolepyruvate ferredoxin oxidoreductase beta subunit